MSGDNETATGRVFDYDRTVALSDGVFAIALTLLVLTISFPDLHGAGRKHIGTELQHRLPQLYSYGLSFGVLAFLWVRHHAFFRSLRQIDTRIVGLNLVYLALVAFLPYPTRLLGVYGSEKISAVLYATHIVLISLLAQLMRLHAGRAGFNQREPNNGWSWNLLAPAVFFASIPVAIFASASAAEWTWIALLVAAASRTARQGHRAPPS